MKFVVFLIKSLVLLALLAVSLLLSVFFFQEKVLHRILEIPLSLSLGVDVEVDRAFYDWESKTLTMEGARIGNPPGFVRQTSFNFERIRLHFSGVADGAVFKISKLEADIRDLRVIRRVSGHLNILSYKPRFEFVNKRFFTDIAQVHIRGIKFIDLSGPLWREDALNLDVDSYMVIADTLGIDSFMYRIAKRVLLLSDKTQEWADMVAIPHDPEQNHEKL